VPVSDLWDMWLERFGGGGRQPKLTEARRKALKRLWKEQLAEEDDPYDVYCKVLRAVERSDHHMSKREYQYPESLFRNENRRDRWVTEAMNLNGDGRHWSARL